MTAIVTHRVGDVAVDFELPDAPGGKDALFVLGIRKSGSSIFNSIVQALAGHNKAPFVDVGGIFFARNVKVEDWIDDESLSAILRPGIVYGGFRNFPVGLSRSEMYRQGRKILMIRDPRDALVSEYFSNAFSHSLPQGDTASGEAALLLKHREAALHASVNEVVLQRARAMQRTLDPLLQMPEDPRLLILRYEDVILRKAELIRRVVAHFGWTCDDGLLQAILSWADVRPSEENPRAFIRKVTPGDHREKLSAQTIADLDTRFGPFLKRFGYA